MPSVHRKTGVVLQNAPCVLTGKVVECVPTASTGGARCGGWWSPTAARCTDPRIPYLTLEVKKLGGD